MTGAAGTNGFLAVIGADVVWTGREELLGRTVWCVGGQIVAAPSATAVGTVGAAGSVDTLDASGCIVTPGLVNAHHHLLQCAFRTRPGGHHVPMDAWLATMAQAYTAAGVDAELCHLAARTGIAEGLLCGVTTVADHHLTWPAGADHLGMAQATMAAATELGARLVFVRGTAGDDPDTAASEVEALAQALALAPAPALAPALAPAPALARAPAEAPAPAEAQAPAPAAAAAPAPAPPQSFPLGSTGVTSDGMFQLAVGPAGVHSDGRRTFEALAAVAARYGLRRRTQANEQVDVQRAASRYGRRPLELLDDWGWLAPDVTLAHLCDPTQSELDRLAASGVTVTHVPGCDVASGWGVAPVAAMLARGIGVGLGTSGGGSNDAGHLLADARLALQVAPLAAASFQAGPGPGVGADAGAGAGAGAGGQPVTARDALTMATAGSAVGLGRGRELGRLDPGSAADLCCWDVRGVADAGVDDRLAGLLWASPGRRPRHVVVAGRVVVRDGHLVGADERAIAADLNRRCQRS